MGADGAVDVFANIALSGEPLIPEIRPEFGSAPKSPLPLLDFYNNSLQLKDFRERYLEYWSSTGKVVTTGKYTLEMENWLSIRAPLSQLIDVISYRSSRRRCYPTNHSSCSGYTGEVLLL